VGLPSIWIFTLGSDRGIIKKYRGIVKLYENQEVTITPFLLSTIRGVVHKYALLNSEIVKIVI